MLQIFIILSIGVLKYNNFIYFVVYTRRGDLESLMYNGLEWLRLPLPWKEKLLKNVIQMKTSLKDAILSNKELSEFKNVPKCKY